MSDKKISRRSMLGHVLRGVGAGALVTGGAVALGRNDSPRQWVWQLDPNKCTQCGLCSTACVLTPSAVKCFHIFKTESAYCGYCRLCMGYFEQQANELNSAAENLLCPTDAIERTYIEPQRYQYTIRQDLCIGCGKCVSGCKRYGNGSMMLQVFHDVCVGCNECAIARVCPADAFSQVSVEAPYLALSEEDADA